MRRGLTLLEVLVALLILSMVVTGYLELFHGGHLLLARSRAWSQAIAYAADGMEQAKLGETNPAALPGGYRRRVTTTAWGPGLEMMTVTVTLPSGARFDLRRLRAH
ncbi:MAG TPA: prepilin-type N-terminal cleavage/methylation domain-containing protein [Gemmatimonadaceae bacterium]|jgi:prepilin-type N-terminal cleavage/methylation domain-containing protein|nr:prepilin-type N-terminal cleavage/methylation domain-containing protein [Gemmatimonadaceae bacterium]